MLAQFAVRRPALAVLALTVLALARPGVRRAGGEFPKDGAPLIARPGPGVARPGPPWPWPRPGRGLRPGRAFALAGACALAARSPWRRISPVIPAPASRRVDAASSPRSSSRAGACAGAPPGVATVGTVDCVHHVDCVLPLAPGPTSRAGADLEGRGLLAGGAICSGSPRGPAPRWTTTAPPTGARPRSPPFVAPGRSWESWPRQSRPVDAPLRRGRGACRGRGPARRRRRGLRAPLGACPSSSFPSYLHPTTMLSRWQRRAGGSAG